MVKDGNHFLRHQHFTAYTAVFTRRQAGLGTGGCLRFIRNGGMPRRFAHIAAEVALDVTRIVVRVCTAVIHPQRNVQRRVLCTDVYLALHSGSTRIIYRTKCRILIERIFLDHNNRRRQIHRVKRHATAEDLRRNACHSIPDIEGAQSCALVKHGISRDPCLRAVDGIIVYRIKRRTPAPRIVSDALHRLGDRDLPQRRTVAKCVFTNGFHTVTKREDRQFSATVERIVSNGLHTVADSYQHQFAAAVKRFFSNAFHSGRDGDRLERGAIVKSTLGNAFHTAAHGNVNQCRAVAERIFTKRCHRIGNRYTRQCRATVKGIIIDRLHTAQIHRLQCRAFIKRAVSHRCHCTGKRHGFQCRASVKRTAPDGSERFREGDRRDGGATVKRAVTDVFHPIRNGECRYLFAVNIQMTRIAERIGCITFKRNTAPSRKIGDIHGEKPLTTRKRIVSDRCNAARKCDRSHVDTPLKRNSGNRGYGIAVKRFGYHHRTADRRIYRSYGGLAVVHNIRKVRNLPCVTVIVCRDRNGLSPHVGGNAYGQQCNHCQPCNYALHISSSPL